MRSGLDPSLLRAEYTARIQFSEEKKKIFGSSAVGNLLIVVPTQKDNKKNSLTKYSTQNSKDFRLVSLVFLHRVLRVDLEQFQHF